VPTDRTFPFGERYTLTLLGEVFNIFNVTNILGVGNRNYSGIATTLSPDHNNPNFSSSFGTPVSTAGGVFGSGGSRAFQLALLGPVLQSAGIPFGTSA
jgi:hypothetical protein